MHSPNQQIELGKYLRLQLPHALKNDGDVEEVCMKFTANTALLEIILPEEKIEDEESVLEILYMEATQKALENISENILKKFHQVIVLVSDPFSSDFLNYLILEKYPESFKKSQVSLVVDQVDSDRPLLENIKNHLEEKTLIILVREEDVVIKDNLNLDLPHFRLRLKDAFAARFTDSILSRPKEFLDFLTEDISDLDRIAIVQKTREVVSDLGFEVVEESDLDKNTSVKLYNPEKDLYVAVTICINHDKSYFVLFETEASLLDEDKIKRLEKFSEVLKDQIDYEITPGEGILAVSLANKSRDLLDPNIYQNLRDVLKKMLSA